LTGNDGPVDGHVSDKRALGNVYACRVSFDGGRARHDGPWFHGHTWDPTEKPHVTGRVLWPNAAFTLAPDNGALEFKGNGLPVREPTGIFPIAPSDSAYRYDTNPNHVGVQHLDFEIPLHPVAASAPTCLPMGMIGFTTTGVAFYNALDAAGRDAAAHEIQDVCDGHRQMNGQYHYHNGSPCIAGVFSDSVLGWALDGYPILGMRSVGGS
jgi:YHYH protein